MFLQNGLKNGSSMRHFLQTSHLRDQGGYQKQDIDCLLVSHFLLWRLLLCQFLLY